MDFQQAIRSIKQLVVQGELEAALEQLSVLCDSDARCGDLGEAARISQAEYNSLKAEILRGTISGEDARLATNRINTRVLQLVRQLETGRFELSDDAGTRRPRRPAWQYYAAGGVVALLLALAGWQFFGKKNAPPVQTQACPVFKPQYTTRVMVLPFRKSSEALKATPEFDISDRLNSLFNRTPKMKASVLADVYEDYDIESNYPNPAEAEDQANECSVQMIVWGRVSETDGQNIRLNVFYRLLNAKQLLSSGDTTISRLVTVTDQGNITRDVDAVDAVSNLLYVVLANQLQADIPREVIAQLNQAQARIAKADSSAPSLDTLSTLVLAEHYIQNKQPDLAMQELDALLTVYPMHSRARQTRAALLAAQGKYEEAARDLEIAAPEPARASVELNEARTELFLRSGQLQKAEEELDMLDKKGTNPRWKENKRRELQVSKQEARANLQRYQTQAARQPANAAIKVRIAEEQLKLGNEKAAVQTAETAARQDPKNAEARSVLIEARLQTGDTLGARRALDEADRAGLRVKGIARDVLRVTPLRGGN